MLSHQLKTIFVHIPKNAGQSVEKCLLQYHDSSWEERGNFLMGENENPVKGPPRLAHLTASEYVSYGYVTPEDFERYFKFSFVRNPWARLVSEYKWRGYFRRWRFKDWLNNHFPEPGRNSQWRHVMPQYNYLFDAKGKCLVDFIGHFEKIKDDFDVVNASLGGNLPALPHSNKSLDKEKGIQSLLSLKRLRLMAKRLKSKEPFHDSYLDYYDDQTWKWVEKRYEKDIEMFHYTNR
ncbi:MAG: sulfotransferase family 2 domain-containing protein [Cyanobacteria bacterium J06555_13]